MQGEKGEGIKQNKQKTLIDRQHYGDYQRERGMERNRKKVEVLLFRFFPDEVQ